MSDAIMSAIAERAIAERDEARAALNRATEITVSFSDGRVSPKVRTVASFAWLLFAIYAQTQRADSAIVIGAIICATVWLPK